MPKTSIEWTDRTWNPLRGCSRTSEGCRHCYAETIAERFSGPGQAFEGFATRGKGWTGKLALLPHLLEEPARWREPQRVFVNSMSDLFHEKLTNEEIAAVFGVMGLAHQHTYQVLTKRAVRLPDWYASFSRRGPLSECVSAAYIAHPPLADLFPLDAAGAMELSMRSWPLPNVWLGVSVENQEAADERIPLLLETPAAVRFLSVEPLLGPVDVRAYLEGNCGECGRSIPYRGAVCPCGHITVDPGVTWVIVGGESGPGARPMHPDWARAIRDQCVAAGVPFFFKQWGAYGTASVSMTLDLIGRRHPIFRQYATFEDWVAKASTRGRGGVCLDRAGNVLTCGADFERARDAGLFPVTILDKLGKKAAGRELDGRTWDQLPSRP